MCDEGTEVAYRNVQSSLGCQNKCEETEGCESFTFCGRNDGVPSDCYLKDKILTGDEATKGVSNCASYYKNCDYGTYIVQISKYFKN